MKLGNFARLDPALQSRGIKGLSNGAKGEVEVWEEFKRQPEELAYESQTLRAQKMGISVEKLASITMTELPAEGQERRAIVKQRVNQSLFRERILSAYNNKCCITGLSIPTLLIAGHIIPWSKDKKNRLNPKNGLCLNMLHDKAFDRGLMWIDDNFTIHYRDDFFESSSSKSEVTQWLESYQGRQLILPDGFRPSREFLKSHAKEAMA